LSCRHTSSRRVRRALATAASNSRRGRGRSARFRGPPGLWCGAAIRHKFRRRSSALCRLARDTRRVTVLLGQRGDVCVQGRLVDIVDAGNIEEPTDRPGEGPENRRSAPQRQLGGVAFGGRSPLLRQTPRRSTLFRGIGQKTSLTRAARSASWYDGAPCPCNYSDGPDAPVPTTSAARARLDSEPPGSCARGRLLPCIG
jgi:hypothetical protein